MDITVITFTNLHKNVEFSMSADKMDLVYDKCCTNFLYIQCHPWTLLSVHFMKSKLYNYTIEVDYKYAPLIPYYLTYKLREWLRKLWKKLKAVDTGWYA